jgi:uncharacterized protein with PQ loop repeat
MIAQTLGWIATFLFTVCYVPQIAKTLRTGKLDGLSITMLAVQFIANIVALEYAILIEQPPLVIKYVLAILFVGGTLAAVGIVWLHQNYGKAR